MQRRGGKLLAISVDPPVDSRRVVEAANLPFPILSDADRTVIHAYGVVHPRGGPHGEEIALPSMFLIDKTGRIVWERVARTVVDRPDPGEVLEAVRTHL